MRPLRPSLAVLLALAAPLTASAQEADEFTFFQTEAKVVTASRRPTPASTAPSTVYTVTAEDIRASGAQTLWDALRVVPGVDVMNDRTSHADVSIRGMNTVLNNRTLVLLDGKTVLNGFLDYTNWETIPVTLEEVDRIEVVEGPASALYGSNAVHGVINIITKTPDRLRGGVLSYTGGERSTQVGQAVIGDRRGPHAYKVGLGWRSTNKFAVAADEASAVGKAHALYSYDFGEDSRVSVSGGVADHDVNLSNGPSFDYGQTGFARADFRTGATTARVFWNFGRTEFRENPTFATAVRNDTYDASVERTFDLPAANFLTAGASYRRNTASSNLFRPGVRDQALYGLYFEDSWSATERWTFVLSGRADRHPYTLWQYSPRGSAIYAPNETHSFRATAAQAFRNPTLLENYFDVDLNGLPVSTVPGFTRADLVVVPNTALDPERITFFEAAHRGSWESVRTGVTGFFYRVTNLVTATSVVDLTAPPTLVQRSFVVNAGETKAAGFELSVEAQAREWLIPFANYSYESLVDQREAQTTARSAPRHKGNVGARIKRRLWTANAWLHVVDATWWSDGTSADHPVYAKVPAYAMLNVAATRRFTGRLDGLELTVAGFNVADDHYELLPRQSATAPGRNGGPIKSRWSGTLAWRFGLPR